MKIRKTVLNKRKMHYNIEIKVLVFGLCSILIGSSFVSAEFISENKLESIQNNTSTNIDICDHENEHDTMGRSGPAFQLYKFFWNSTTKQWVSSLDLTSSSQSVVPVLIVIRNTAPCECLDDVEDHHGCTWAPTTFEVTDEIGTGVTEASAEVSWPPNGHNDGGCVQVSDYAELISPVDCSYVEGSAWAGNYWLPPHLEERMTYPIMPIVDEDSFCWTLEIDPHFQPYSELYMLYVLKRGHPKYFIHISDTHWGTGDGDASWASFVNHAWVVDDLPQFIVCTGDIVDYGYKYVNGNIQYPLFQQFFSPGNNKHLVGSRGDWKVEIQALTDPQGSEYETVQVPIYFCIGNHDRREWWPQGPGDWPGSKPFTNDVGGYVQYVDDLYYVRRPDPSANIVLCSLDSGDDALTFYGDIGTPEGNGLYDDQVIRLVIDLFSSGESSSKVILHHHPIRNLYGEDGDLLDGAFLNQYRFINYVLNQYDNIYLLFGHAGKPWSDILNVGGKQVRLNCANEFRNHRAIKLFFYDSQGIINYGGRNGLRQSDPLTILQDNSIYLASTMAIEADGKIYLDAYDEAGHHTGLDDNGEIETEIPGSSCSGVHFENQSLNIDTNYIGIYLNKDESKDYRFKITALAEGTVNISVSFDLQSENLLDGDPNRDGKYIKAYYNNTVMYEGSVATIYANNSWVDYIMKIQDPDEPVRTVFPSGIEGDDIVLVNPPPYNGNNPLCYDTIHEGLEAIHDYGMVYVYPGIYNYDQEGLQITKPLRLCGANKETTTIRCGVNGDLRLNIAHSDVTICGFTISGSVNSGFEYNEGYAPGYTNIILSGNIINGDVTFNYIDGNTLSHNTFNGQVVLSVSRKNTITENIIHNELILEYSSYNIISKNAYLFVRGNGDPAQQYIIFLDDRSDLNIISENTLNGAGTSFITGVYLVGESHNNIISKNDISNCENMGIYYGDSDYGNNKIYQNNLFSNTDNAYDYGTNTWYNIDLQEGNYWDDYVENGGYDSDEDGIGDIPYSIPPGDNQDMYPLMCSWPPISGDLDHDGDVDHSDLGILLAAWDSHPGDDNWDDRADIDDDDHVYHSDLGILLANWGYGT